MTITNDEYTWTCAGEAGGTNASCSAQKSEIGFYWSDLTGAITLLDAKNIQSYSGMGIARNDISTNGNDFTLYPTNGGPSFDAQNKYFILDGNNDAIYKYRVTDIDRQE